MSIYTYIHPCVCKDQSHALKCFDQCRPRGLNCKSRAWSVAEAAVPRNGLVSVHDRDPAGWSCMCYAAINGNPKLITRLLEHSGDPNDRTLKGKDEAYLAKWMPLLSLCAYFSNNDAIKILLEAKANPNQRDGRNLGTKKIQRFGTSTALLLIGNALLEVP